MTELDLVNRDPNNVNEIKMNFEDILAEPDAIHSSDGVWKNSFTCYITCRGCCYKTLTFIFGIPFSACWGLQFAFLAFAKIWFLTPSVQCYFIYCNIIERINEAIVNCCCKPMSQVLAYCSGSFPIPIPVSQP